MIVYQRITDSDKINEICQLISNKKLYEPTGDFQNWVRVPSILSSVFVAFDGDELVGYAMSRSYVSNWRYNGGVYVEPKYRRKGIGTELMSRIHAVESRLVVDIYNNESKENFFNHVEKVSNKGFHYKY
jgi:GNAT superfamily N-acetyltransferase